MAQKNVRRLRLTMTDAERCLWFALRGRRLAGYKFRRQHPIGNFIVDFACARHRLVVEADGATHVGSSTDARRTAIIEAEGWRVLRFWNSDILGNTEGVIDTILRALNARIDPHPTGADAPATLSRGVGEGNSAPDISLSRTAGEGGSRRQPRDG